MNRAHLFRNEDDLGEVVITDSHFEVDEGRLGTGVARFLKPGESSISFISPVHLDQLLGTYSLHFDHGPDQEFATFDIQPRGERFFVTAQF
jgi:hypothetical protein